MHHVKVAIIGAGNGGSSILKVLTMLENIKVVGVCDINPNTPGMKLADSKGIFTTTNFEDLVKSKDVDVIIEATGIKEVQKKIHHLKPESTAIMEAQAANLMMILVKEREKLLKVNETKEELSAILNSAQEGIQVADVNGKVTYINKSFTKITKVRPAERIGKSVFDVSPNGALAEVLKTGLPVFGKRNFIKDKGIEVVSNASPIKVNGKMIGAVVVFRDITDYRKMAKKLEESNKVIKFLQGEIKQLTLAQYTFDDLVGINPEFLKGINIARRAAQSDSTVLIQGESGTGKELFAHAIHNYGPRSNGPFIKVNCAAIPNSLLESELFGYEKGAFTGAYKTKIGKFELAHGGSIFLDEIGDMNTYLQAKLLRVLQEKEVERLGSNKPLHVDVRIIAATNRNLKNLINNNKFRKDLFYRLNVINISIPPLRERKEDIIPLTKHIIKKLNKRLGKDIIDVSQQAQNMLMGYSWPGNVRELQNLLERVVTLSDKEVITEQMLKPYLERHFGHGKEEEILPLAEIEKRMIFKALEKYGFSLEGKKNAAQKLDISLATLYNKLKQYKKEDDDSKK